MNTASVFHQWRTLPRRIQTLGLLRGFSIHANEDEKTKEVVDYLENLKNFEKLGVPEGAGTNSDDGFDLERMHRLMERLGNPHSKFKAVHIAGTKGKGSTSAFLSNILRKEGYSVGCYTSPHLWSIRERISLGTKGEPVSAEALNRLFHQVKSILDQSIQMENGSLSHFEVLTALAFTLFAEENVDIAVIEAGLGGARDATNVFSSSGLAASVITTIGEEHMAALGGSLESIAMAKSGIIKHGIPVVLGGPFKPHIERIIRDRASSMSSPVVLASDPGNRSNIKGFIVKDGKACQSCNILIQLDKDLQLFIELPDVKLLMLGSHQLQNAVTATCASLCLRHLAHTKESAKSLVDTIQLTHPDAAVALIVAMANDKDHLSFAKQILSVRQPKVVILTEVGIADDRARMTPASLLKAKWIQGFLELGIDFIDNGVGADEKLLAEKSGSRPGKVKDATVLTIAASVEESMKIAGRVLKEAERSHLIVVTGSLHIVSQALASH